MTPLPHTYKEHVFWTCKIFTVCTTYFSDICCDYTYTYICNIEIYKLDDVNYIACRGKLYLLWLMYSGEKNN